VRTFPVPKAALDRIQAKFCDIRLLDSKTQQNYPKYQRLKSLRYTACAKHNHNSAVCRSPVSPVLQKILDRNK